MSHLILFDKSCPFCQRSILFILKRDFKRQFLFSSLDGKVAKSMSQILHISDKESLTLIENYNTSKQAIFYRSRAVFKILWMLGGFWKIIGLNYKLPPSLFDWLYNLVSRNRKRLCKKAPSIENEFDRKRFLP